MDQIDIKEKRILVTGGAGVIGRELLRLLIDQGANVLSIDRNPLPEGNWVNIVHIEKDIAVDNLPEVIDFQPQIILHLAAAFERSKESPGFWQVNWHDNMLLSHRLIDSIKGTPKLETFVFASSYLIYSPSLYLSPSLYDNAIHLDEDCSIEPRNICGTAKYYTEKELRFIEDIVNPSWRVVNARIFRVYGCGSNDVISRWVRAALSGNEIEVYNRENRFDYIFARDVAEGLLRLACNSNARGPVNLGSGVARSIRDVLDVLIGFLPEARDRIKFIDMNEPYESSCADLTKLKHFVGWVPSIDIEKGIGIIAEFERNNKD